MFAIYQQNNQKYWHLKNETIVSISIWITYSWDSKKNIKEIDLEIYVWEILDMNHDWFSTILIEIWNTWCNHKYNHNNSFKVILMQ
jgi:hypothetical protein